MEKVILFGASELGKKAFKELKEKYDIKYFCDNDKNKIGKKIYDVEVIDSERLSELKDYTIIITSIYYLEICKQLNKMNITNYVCSFCIGTPMMKVINELLNRNINLSKINALEVFGAKGELHTLDYYTRVRSLQVWEYNRKLEHELRKNLPDANVKITDSFKEVKCTDKKYDMVVVDNSPGTYGDYCEHFNLFPQIYRVFNNEVILILNVLPKRTEESDNYQFTDCFNEKHNFYRKLFYSVNNPENIDIDYMAKVYKNISKLHGYNLEWYFSVKRTFVHYLVLKLNKI